MKKILKSVKGITLIALVITIIVILILSGVVINMITDEEGILNKVVSAKENREESSTVEKIKLAMTAATINDDYKINKNNLKTELEKYFKTNDVYEYEDGTFLIIVEGKRYKVSNDGNIVKSNYKLEKVKSEEDNITLINSDGGVLYDYKIYGNSIQNELPKEYQQVNFIESTGTQCIDTEYVPKTNTKIECELSFDGDFNNKVNTSIFGTSNKENIFTINFGGEPNQKNELFSWTDKLYENGATAYCIDITDKIRTNRNLLTLESGKVSYGGITKTIATKTENQTETLILFGKRNVKGIFPIQAYNMRVYSFKIYEDDNLIKYMLPCYRRDSGKIGMYDLIAGKFYTNVYTDEFEKSKDISLSVGDIVIEGDYKGKYEIPIEVDVKNLWDRNSKVIADKDVRSALFEFHSSDNCWLKPNTTYNFSEDVIIYNDDTRTNPRFCIQTYYIDGTYDNVYYWLKKDSIKRKISAKITTGNKEVSKMRIRLVDYGSNEGGVWHAEAENMQLEIGSSMTDYKSYQEPRITSIYLNQPLRKVGDYVDCIDFKNKKVIRRISENNEILINPIEEIIELPDILTNIGTHIIKVNTLIKPTNIEATYYKQE